MANKEIMKYATEADYQEYVRQCQRYYGDEDDGTIMADDEEDDDEDERTKFRVAITYEAWNGEKTIEHEYDRAEQAVAVYERVCRIWNHKGYQPIGYGECWERVYETTDRNGNEVNYTVELY